MAGFDDHFSIIADAIAPQPWMQLREVASESVAAVAKKYDPSDGLAKNDLLQTVKTSWTNNTPIAQLVYGLVTRDGCRVTLQTRSRAYLKTSHGMRIGVGAIPMVDVNKFGTGADIGKGGLLSTNSAFSILELRQNSQTDYLLPATTGMFLVQPGETINTQVEVRFVSDFWEGSAIDGGTSGTDSSIQSGETLLQLMALPTVTPPPPVDIPTIVGGAGNVKWDIAFNDVTIIDKPAGMIAGDTLVAITCTQFGFSNTIQPSESGWTLAHSRESWLLGGAGDVHMKIWTRVITGAEPAQFTFGGSFFAEGISILIPIRDAVPFDDSSAANWFIGSNLSNWKIVEEHVAPSIDRGGQLLLAVSYFDHAPMQSPITQLPPDGMTELVDIPGQISTIAVAYLPTPPAPTFTRQFTPSVIPFFRGHSIAAAILIPGVQEV